MANEEQLDVFEKGVDAWNEWREENPSIEIDLSGTTLIVENGMEDILRAQKIKGSFLHTGDLSGVNLGKANLSGSNFSEANLDRANLVEANLNGIDLAGVNLGGTNFTGANLTEADLTGANLTEADLSEATLIGANLSFADLNGADISKADLTNANLNGANLHLANLSSTYLSAANLNEANLSGADLRGANLGDAKLILANLIEADLSEANLSGANLSEAVLIEANLSRANLSGANLSSADLNGANLSSADLSKTGLTGASLIATVIEKTKISGSLVYGISVWDLEGEFEEQKDLVITRKGQPIITVDNIKVAQFIYLILNNEEIRDVINTLTSKSVLILGRFAIPERKAILDALRNKLRDYNLLPIVFDFDRPTDKDFTETIKTLAGLSYFVIADITNPKSSPLELQATVPDYQIPFVPIIQEGESPFAMMVDLQKKYNWVLETRSYDSIETLMKALKPGIIDPAIKMHYELRLIKAKEQNVHPLRDFIDK